MAIVLSNKWLNVNGLVVLLVMLGLQFTLQAQNAPKTIVIQKDTVAPPKTFEGSITYKIEYMGETGKVIGNILHDTVTVFVKGSQLLYKFSGRKVAEKETGTLLVDGKKGTISRILEGEKKVQVYEPEVNTIRSLNTFTPLKKTETIAKLKCQLYEGKMGMPGSGGKATIWAWVHPSIQLPSDTTLAGYGLLSCPGLPGLPLKKVINFSTDDMQLIITAVKVNTTPLEDALFEIPRGYRTQPFDPEQVLDINF